MRDGEIERWSKKISDSIKKSSVIKQLINNKSSRQFENRKILMNILKILMSMRYVRNYAIARLYNYEIGSQFVELVH